LSIEELHEAPWNSNEMDEGMLSKLKASLSRYGLVENLVVRPVGKGQYEVVSGNQRLKLLRQMGHASVPCVVVEVDNAETRLLAQALNRVHGEDDLGLKAELVREILEHVPEPRVVELLPETSNSLQALAAMGQQSLAEHLQAWERAQAARLRHLTFQLTPSQLEVVEEVLEQIVPEVGVSPEGNPNRRGQALYLLCREWLEARDKYTPESIRRSRSGRE